MLSVACADLKNANTGVSDCSSRTALCTNSVKFSEIISFISHWFRNKIRKVADGQVASSVYREMQSVWFGCKSINFLGIEVSTIRPLSMPISRLSLSSNIESNSTYPPPKGSTHASFQAYASMMRTQCPATCGFCSSCVDLINPKTGTSDCPNLAAQGYCARSVTFQFSDIVISSKTNISLIERLLFLFQDYATLMRQQCAKSCGFC